MTDLEQEIADCLRLLDSLVQATDQIEATDSKAKYLNFLEKVALIKELQAKLDRLESSIKG